MTQKGELTEANMYAVFGAALVGSLSFIFADSFWFSATEASVWSASLCFSTLMFWCGTKMARSKEPERWVILISFLIGLSIGVHMLCILVIPAITFLYFYREHQNSTTPKWFTGLLNIFTKKPESQKLLAASIAAIVLLGSVKSLVIPGLINVATWFELFFVNSMGLPFNSGVLIYGLAIAAFIVWGLIYSKKNNKAGTHTAFMSAAVLIVGYCSFVMLVIRANADTPLNEDRPSDTIMLHDYLDRKQYGDFPVLYGPYFTAPVVSEKDNGPVYEKAEGKKKYIEISRNETPVFAKDFSTLFTRMWDASEGHPQEYKNWTGDDYDKVPYTDAEGKKSIIERPGFFRDNLEYFIRYQVGLMYFRYLLWDFCGRQNDIQGVDPPDNLHGNFITGIPFIDSMRQPQDNMPDELAKNKARNVMYGIPFLFGLLGFFYMAKKDPKRFTIVLVMFFFTGLAIILFLNQKPHEPRERDYSYVGSFFAFSIWVGFGALALYDFLSKRIAKGDGTKGLAILTTLGCMVVPALMAHAEWDDHDRSKRYTTRDFAIDYLESCPKNAILFTAGDNDTFPLWYAQEVEGIRTDVRVCNMELMGMAWYVDQMNHKAYESERMPFSMTHDQYREGTRDYLLYYDAPGSKFSGHYNNLADVVEFIKSDNDNDKIELSNQKMENFLPTKKFKIPVNKAEAIKSGIIPKNMVDSIPSEITWDMPGNNIMRSNLLELDAIAHNDWKRPLCFAVSSGSEAYIGLQNYFQLHGLVFVLTPFKSKGNVNREPAVNTDVMYDNWVHKFRWGNMDKGIYLDENICRMAITMRYQANTLANSLLAQNKKDSALKVLTICMDSISEESCPYDGSVVMMTRTFYEVGATAKANALAEKLFGIFEKDLIYYNSLTGNAAIYYGEETQNYEVILQQLTLYTQQYKQDALEKKFQDRLQKLNKMGYLKYITRQ